MYQIILASKSPRRKDIMELMGIPFQIIPSMVEEIVDEAEPAKMVQALSALKADDIASKILTYEADRSCGSKDQMDRNDDSKDRMDGIDGSMDIIIIGADTMVFYQGNALGKPRNEADARRMLMLLSGNTHEVYTGVSLIIIRNRRIDKKIVFALCTKVVFQNLNQEQIDDYIASREPMDKAGAYAIQGSFGIFVKEIIGDYYNVVGLPIAKIYETLLKEGIDIKKQN